MTSVLTCEKMALADLFKRHLEASELRIFKVTEDLVPKLTSKKNSLLSGRLGTNVSMLGEPRFDLNHLIS